MIKFKNGIVIILCCVLCFLFQVSNVHAGEKNIGTTGAQFLKIGIGARPAGMGGAFCAIADDINSIYWNPGGLSQITNKELTLMHADWFQEIMYEYIAYAQKMGRLSTLAASIMYLHMDSIKETTLDNPFGTGNEFTAHDMGITLSYGREINRNISTGASIKIVSQKIKDKSATAYILDLGGLYKTSIGLNIAVVLQNIGTKIKFIEKGNAVPLNLKLGCAYKLVKLLDDDLLTLALDIDIPSDNNINAHFGTEYLYKSLKNLEIAGRLGYKTRTIADLDGLSGLSVGVGFKFKNYGFDYAWVPYGDLGNTHRISLNVRF